MLQMKQRLTLGALPLPPSVESISLLVYIYILIFGLFVSTFVKLGRSSLLHTMGRSAIYPFFSCVTPLALFLIHL